MSNLDKWLLDMNQNKWIMPFAPWWKRLPIVRHVRAAALKIKVENRTEYDEWVLYGIWHGLERNECENV